MKMPELIPVSLGIFQVQLMARPFSLRFHLCPPSALCGSNSPAGAGRHRSFLGIVATFAFPLRAFTLAQRSLWAAAILAYRFAEVDHVRLRHSN
jgi:hypothetical protein